MAQFDTARQAGVGAVPADIDVGLRAHMSKIYGLMSIAMLVTGAVAYVVGMDFRAATNQEPTTIVPVALLQMMYNSPGRYIVMFAPLAFVLGLGFGINKLSVGAAQALFYLFSAIMGLSISWIFAVYQIGSIAQVFFITAIAFASLSIYGYTTKRNLSGMGSFLFMGLIGLIGASIFNVFFPSDALTFAISVIGVLIFAGLTAYDTQRIKVEYIQLVNQPGGMAWLQKSAILAALSLYINFLNMFMFLLQLLGNRE